MAGRSCRRTLGDGNRLTLAHRTGAGHRANEAPCRESVTEASSDRSPTVCPDTTPERPRRSARPPRRRPRRPSPAGRPRRACPPAPAWRQPSSARAGRLQQGARPRGRPRVPSWLGEHPQAGANRGRGASLQPSQRLGQLGGIGVVASGLAEAGRRQVGVEGAAPQSDTAARTARGGRMQRVPDLPERRLPHRVSRFGQRRLRRSRSLVDRLAKARHSLTEVIGAGSAFGHRLLRVPGVRAGGEELSDEVRFLRRDLVDGPGTERRLAQLADGSRCCGVRGSELLGLRCTPRDEL